MRLLKRTCVSEQPEISAPVIQHWTSSSGLLHSCTRSKPCRVVSLELPMPGPVQKKLSEQPWQTCRKSLSERALPVIPYSEHPCTAWRQGSARLPCCHGHPAASFFAVKKREAYCWSLGLRSILWSVTLIYGMLPGESQRNSSQFAPRMAH